MARLSVVNRLFLILVLLSANLSWAAPAAIVTHLSGTLSVKKADGSTRILSQQSEVDNGDTLSTEKDSFARLKFTDGGEVTLRPNSVFKLEGYAFEESAPRQDSFLVSLLKGGLRTVTGAIGKRGNSEAYRMNTATATIGIRGTYYTVLTCKGDCPNGMEDGTYAKILEGAIIVRNSFGEIRCSAGQICLSPPGAPPFVLPQDPGVDFKTPPQMDKTVEGDTVLDPAGHQQCIITAH